MNMIFLCNSNFSYLTIYNINKNFDFESSSFMYKTHEKYYIIIMNFKNDKEYLAALKNFVKLRNDKNTPVLTLAKMYGNALVFGNELIDYVVK